MRNQAPLKLVDKPDEPRIDIYAADRAKRESIDWAAMHIAADRREPVEIADTRKGWAR